MGKLEYFQNLLPGLSPINVFTTAAARAGGGGRLFSPPLCCLIGMLPVSLSVAGHPPGEFPLERTGREAGPHRGGGGVCVARAAARGDEQSQASCER